MDNCKGRFCPDLWHTWLLIPTNWEESLFLAVSIYLFLYYKKYGITIHPQIPKPDTKR